LAGHKETGSSSISFLRNICTASAPELLHDELEQQIIAKRNNSPTAHDITVLYAEVLSQSRKNQLKNRLGFKESDKVYLQFFSYLEEMDRATANILAALDMAGFIDEEIRKMKIVLTELLVNAVVHGNRKDPTKKVVVGHLVDKNRAIVSVMDEGAGFEPSVIPDPTLPENLEKPCGRGLFIVRHYVESISFNETASRVTIIKSNLAN
jgi:serine/threonine-protein kinase RsbW